MRKTLFLFLLIVIGGEFISAQCQSQQQRYIYLWDVTESMKGYDKTKKDYSGQNIYNDVVQFLVGDIQSIKDQNTTIIVCPFQANGGVLKEWTHRADMNGKKAIIDSIRSYSNNDKTQTDIVSAIQYAKKYLINPNQFNRLVILTDGSQNTSKDWGKALDMRDFNNEIRDWKVCASLLNAKALYITVGEALDIELPEELKESHPSITVVPASEPGKAQLIDLCPQNLRLSVNDLYGITDTTLHVLFSQNTKNDLGSDIPEVDLVITDASEILRDTIFTGLPIQNNAIALPLRFTKTGEVLHDILDAGEIVLPIYLKITNAQELKALVNLRSDSVLLTLVNKPEPRLTIRQKRK